MAMIPARCCRIEHHVGVTYIRIPDPVNSQELAVLSGFHQPSGEYEFLFTFHPIGTLGGSRGQFHLWLMC
jgi:hypothetical protein